jgi:hypothetical protein
LATVLAVQANTFDSPPDESGKEKKYAEGRDLVAKAKELDPCRTYFMLGDNDAAIEWCLKTLESNPIWPAGTYAWLAMAYAVKGEDAKARAAGAEVRRLDDPDTKLSEFDNPKTVSPAAYKEWYENVLVPAWRKAGLPE